MSPPPPSPKRRSPSQSRSRETVAIIVQATARVLVKEGFEACSTNRVAREAGVSIGSVYQYFPDKHALVVAVMEHHLEQLQEAMVHRLGELAGASPETVVREMVRAMLESRRIQPRLHRVLLEQVPRIGALKRLHELHSQYVPLLTEWLEAHPHVRGDTPASVVAFVLIAAVEGVLTRVMLERQSWLEAGLLEAQLTRLVLAYLRPL